MLVRTKSAYDYSSVDDRFLTHNGVIVDCGAQGWDMFSSIIGKKRIIGIDPFGEPVPEGVDWVEGVLAPFDGTSAISNKGDESSLNGPETDYFVKCYSWKTFIGRNNINSVSILKLNIEGAEYPLLHSMDSDDFGKIDQIMVSFHDWINPKWEELTRSAAFLLDSNGFDLVHTASQYGWRLYVKR